MSRRIWSVISATIVTSLLLSTAVLNSGHAHAKTLTFYVIPGISTDPFYITVGRGAKAAGKKLGVNIVYQGAPNAFSPQTQIPILNAAVTRHPDAILIAPTDKTALISPIRAAIKAGVPVATFDTFITAPIAFTNVSSDNIAGGHAAGKAMAQATGGKGEVAFMDVAAGISTGDQRMQGFVQIIKQHSGMKYIGTQYDTDDTPTKSAGLTSALLTGHPNLAGICSVNGLTGSGVRNAVLHAGKAHKVKLVDFYSDPAQVPALKSGVLTAVIAQDPFTIGYKSVQLAYNWVTKHRSGIHKHYTIPQSIITKANMNTPANQRLLYK